MKKKVLLVVPYIHDFAAYDLWVKPLGLLYIASAIEKNGYETRVVNCLDRLHPAASSAHGSRRAKSYRGGRGKFSYEVIAKPKCLARVPRTYRRYGIPLDVFRRELSDGPVPDIIGVSSMMTYWYGGVAETVEMVREVYPGVPVVLGGVYATLCPNHSREHVRADAVVEGPGEKQFLLILDSMTGGGVRQETSHLFRPAYHLLQHLDSVSMLTSLGCPFGCEYCASRLLHQGFFQRATKDVVDEIIYYGQTMGIKDIAFYDDALLSNPNNHIKPILHEIIERDLGLRFHTPNGLHPNKIDGELAGLMKAAGFVTVRLSIESIYEVRIKDSCLKVTPEGFRAAVSNLRAAGYPAGSVEAYVLMGVPGQHSEEVEGTMHFVHESGAVIRLADFSPIPGTGYFDAAVQSYGLDPTEPLFQNSSALPYLVPGLIEQYQRLKDLARSLNSRLAARA